MRLQDAFVDVARESEVVRVDDQALGGQRAKGRLGGQIKIALVLCAETSLDWRGNL